jgi:glycosyltransferase involved in cell wall biosynthesis
MNVAHVLRKYDPAQWGGTESAVKQLASGLAIQGVHSTFFAPELPLEPRSDPLAEAGHIVKRYHAFVPVARISREQREQLVSIGGNLMSFDLIWKLWREPDIQIIHTHTANRIGGIALTVARKRKIPSVLTIHGGALDLPQSVREALSKPLQGGLEWGKVFGPPLRSRHVLSDANAILTCNPREAELLREKYPGKRVMVQPHGVTTSAYARDYRATALGAFPQLAQRDVILVIGRIDPAKNQSFALQHIREISRHHPSCLLVFAGACTDESYGKALKKEIERSNLEQTVFFTGGLPPGDPRLVGLLQYAKVVVVPSLSETFGLVILEAWAAGTPVISTRTSGALSLVEPGRNGWLFDLDQPGEFLRAIDEVLKNPAKAGQLAAAGRELVARDYDTGVLAARIRSFYEELIQEIA